MELSSRMPDSQSSEPVFESPFCYRFEDLAFFVLSIDAPVDSELCINEYLAVDSRGNVSEYRFFARNCCVA